MKSGVFFGSALSLAAVALPAFIPAASFAAESQFGFTYTTDLLPKGEKEIEQWVTWRSKKIDGTFNMLEGRTAFEYGVTDNFQLALYLTYDWTEAYHNGPFGATTPPEPFLYDQPGPDDFYKATRFVGVSVEGVYRILSPYLDPVGLAFYLEPTVGPGFIEAESKLILQKNYLDDTLTFGFNFTYAPEFRLLPADPGSGDTGNSWQEETDVNLSFGASYRFIPNWSGGFEFFNEREFNSYNFSHLANNAYYLGPSIHYGGKGFFVTAVFTAQLPWVGYNVETAPGAVVNGYNLDVDNDRYRARVKVGFYL